MAISKQSDFYPFYDPYRGGDTLGYGAKISVSLAFGSIYLLLQYLSLANKMVFFTQYCWILGIIISTSLLALYVATDVFRRSLVTMRNIEGENSMSGEFIDEWLNDKWYFFAGFGFATVNTSVAHILGVPAEFHESVFSLSMMYVGFFFAGFASGMGLLAIITVIGLYLKFAPRLHYSLDPNNADGNGGIKKLGDSLWLFGGLIGAVGILVAIYMFGVSWTYAYKGYVQVVFLLWTSFPFVVAISIVLIPGLAVRRQVSYYKTYRSKQLKNEKMKAYSNYKQFASKEDEAIIAEKKELSDKLNRIQEELGRLKKMRNSHIDGKD